MLNNQAWQLRNLKLKQGGGSKLWRSTVWGSGIHLLTNALCIRRRRWVAAAVHLQQSLLGYTGLNSDLAGSRGPAS